MGGAAQLLSLGGYGRFIPSTSCKQDWLYQMVSRRLLFAVLGLCRITRLFQILVGREILAAFHVAANSRWHLCFV